MGLVGGVIAYLMIVVDVRSLDRRLGPVRVASMALLVLLLGVAYCVAAYLVPLLCAASTPRTPRGPSNRATRRSRTA